MLTLEYIFLEHKILIILQDIYLQGTVHRQEAAELVFKTPSVFIKLI